MFRPEYAIEIVNQRITKCEAYTAGDDVSNVIRDGSIFTCNHWDVTMNGGDFPGIHVRHSLSEQEKPYQHTYPVQSGTLLLGSDNGRYRSSFVKSDLMSRLSDYGITELTYGTPGLGYDTNWYNLINGSGDFLVVISDASVRIMLSAQRLGDIRYIVHSSARWVIAASNKVDNTRTSVSVDLITEVDDVSSLFAEFDTFLGEHDLSDFRDLLDYGPEMVKTLEATS